MPTRLVALRVPPERFGERLRALWDAGDAVLPLPWAPAGRSADGTADHVAAILARHRPARIVEHTASGLVERDLEASHEVVDGTALVVTTSGSTGEPRGVVLSHEALAASTRASLDRLGVGPGARFVLTLPAHHVAGIQVFLRAWECGTEPVVVDDPEHIGAPGGWIVSLVSTQLRRIVAEAPDVLGAVDTILVGGGPVDDAAVAAAERRGVRVVRSYGMTETCGGCVYDGFPLDGVEVSVTRDSRLRVRGPVLLTGLHPDAVDVLDDEGWFVTGDVGSVTDGCVHVDGRADDVVVTGGENVPAGAVANTLRSHPGIRDAVVGGWPDEEWGETVVAVVVPEPGAPPVTLEAVRDHVRRHHPAAWAPRRIVITDALPHDPMGKLRHDDVRGVVERGLRD